MSMRRLVTIAALLGLACSSGGANSDGGGGNGGGDDGASTAGTCQGIRLCVRDCVDDTCVATCKQMGTADAQTTFQALWDCTTTTAACAPPYDFACVCAAQCIMDPPCATFLDACIPGITSDPICDVQCH